jgi:hypothetical protein
MARPNTRQGLVDYCLRSLGAPVIEINIDDDQIEDRVDEAIQFYQEYHSDAVTRIFYKYEITPTDIANQWIPLPEAMISVLRILPIDSSFSSSTNMFSFQSQMDMSDMFISGSQGAGGLIDIEMTRQYMSLIDMQINGLSQMINFSRHMNRLIINVNWEESGLVEGVYVMVEGYVTIDPEAFTDIYNDMMLKKHLKQLIKKQWAENLIKFEGMQLPGGVTINGRALYEDAINEIAKIEEEYDMKYSFPPDFFVG